MQVCLPSDSAVLGTYGKTGGWGAFQRVLSTVNDIAKKHSVSISAVAIRHSLDISGVSAVIIGTRLNASSSKYTDSSLAAFSFSLDEDDRRRISEAQEGLQDIPGDCGDEYRRPPFLTAAGDLSDHLSEDSERLKRVQEAVKAGRRVEFSSGSPYEPIAVSRFPLHPICRTELPS